MQPEQKPNSHQPLAEKLRPQTLDDFVGQEHILGPGKILRRIIESDRIIPMIFWGPPGCGKTTLAKIISNKTDSNFVFFSAVTSGVADARKLIAQAGEDLEGEGRRTILFVDEIHRFSKSQQDLLLPHVEAGTVTLIGATTENPSFQVNAPLLSRARVFHFRELTISEIEEVVRDAVKKINKQPAGYFPNLSALSSSGRQSHDPGIQTKKQNKNINSSFPRNDKGGGIKISIAKDALATFAKLCDGDVRDAYNALELAIISAPYSSSESVDESRSKIGDSSRLRSNNIDIDQKLAEESIQQKFIRYDKGSDGHYDAISALHKSIRASQPNAALHYLARMLEAGEDPLYVCRRLIRAAAEDIGMADPQALILATSTMDAIHFLGMPEANDIIAELVIYLAKAPKSRAVDDAYAAARSDVINQRLDPIPLKIRNAPTKMMKDFGFGKDYKMYDKDSLLPENLKGKKYYDS